MKRKKIYILVVEGKTEVQYFSQLNQMPEIKDSDLYFKVEAAGGHTPSQVRFAWKNANKKYAQRDKSSVRITLLDKDVFLRKGNKLAIKDYPQNDGIYFSLLNFEDFLVQHLSCDEVKNWKNICKTKNHFSVPLVEDVYIPLLKQYVWNNYDKAHLPIELNLSYLNRLNQNVANNVFCQSNSNDFRMWFLNVLKHHNII